MALMEFHHIYSKAVQPKLLLRILEVIFKQSLNTGELPSDWLTANIYPVFKKVTTVLLKLQTNIPNIILLQNYGACHFSFNNGSHQYK